MKSVVCESCGASTPINETFLVAGRTLCVTCGEACMKQMGTGVLANGAQGQTNSTVYTNYGKDFGGEMLGVPGNTLTFPAWVKLGLLGVLALCVFSFVHNYRFFAAYTEMLRIRQAQKQHDLPKAVALANAAAAHVPESRDLQAIASLYNGLDLLAKDRSAEALPHLRAWQRYAPRDPSIEGILLQAEMGEAFDARDYDRFLAKALEASQAQPDDVKVIANVASAYACKYAVTGQESYKQEAMKYLSEAKQKSTGDEAQLADFEQRLRHRIDSRQIISRKEFRERFPKGYQGEARP
ncbi:MAG: hypothetical protein ACM359_14615 [Bacillota bacterium]